MGVTLQHIADELNVSAMTVSRSLRHDKSIHPETRARVNETARRLGYSARGGRPRRVEEAENQGGTLGFLVCHPDLNILQYDAYLIRMMAGMMSVADKHNMHLKVHTYAPLEKRHWNDDAALVPQLIREGSCRALIVYGEHNDRDLSFLEHRMPVVSLSRVYPDRPIDAAVGDNIEGVRKLVRHLVKLGHRRLVWVGANYSAYFMEGRKLGFVQGCMEAGLPTDSASFLGAEIYQGSRIPDPTALLNAINSGVTGFVCGSDSIAIQVIKHLEAAGKSVPTDVSVTGFDAEARPEPTSIRQITSVDPQFFEIGKAAARMAIHRIDNISDEAYVLSVRSQIVLGETIAPPRST